MAAAFVSTLQAGEVLALDLDDQLIGLSAFLRTDYTAQEFRQLKLKINLDDAFSLFELEHPCVRSALARRLTRLIRTRTRLFITNPEAGWRACLSTAIRC